ncbi:hypothetical protein T492DRAFT_846554 [Pavlovales sp. CCMP2436]|nr:hypothetical protein T492DRAFT_846554 [Pavlovales sp. CCMP2436]
MWGSVLTVAFLLQAGRAERLSSISFHALARDGRRLSSANGAQPDVAERMQLSFAAGNRTFELDLERYNAFADGATLTLNQGGGSMLVAPAKVATYTSIVRPDAREGDAREWARVTYVSQPDGAFSALISARDPTSGNYDWLVVEPELPTGEESYAHAEAQQGAFKQQGKPATLTLRKLRDVPHPAGASGCAEPVHSLEREQPARHHLAGGIWLRDTPDPDVDDDHDSSHAHDHAHDQTRGRELSSLGTLPAKGGSGLYGRLSSCPVKPRVFEFKLGFVVDYGFARRVGGTVAKVQLAVADLVMRTNAIFNDQPLVPITRIM